MKGWFHAVWFILTMFNLLKPLNSGKLKGLNILKSIHVSITEPLTLVFKAFCLKIDLSDINQTHRFYRKCNFKIFVLNRKHNEVLKAAHFEPYCIFISRCLTSCLCFWYEASAWQGSFISFFQSCRRSGG